MIKTEWKLIGSYTISNIIGYNIYRDEEADEWGVMPWQCSAWVETAIMDEDKDALVTSEGVEIPFGEIMRVAFSETVVPHKTEMKKFIMVRCLSLEEAKQLFHEVGSVNNNEYEIEELWKRYGNRLCFGTWPGYDYGKKIILAFACGVDDRYIEEHQVPVYLYDCVDIPYGDWNELDDWEGIK